jgi:hypothetical protein
MKAVDRMEEGSMEKGGREARLVPTSRKTAEDDDDDDDEDEKDSNMAPNQARRWPNQRLTS